MHAQKKRERTNRGLLEEVMEGRKVERNKHITTYYRIAGH